MTMTKIFFIDSIILKRFFIYILTSLNYFPLNIMQFLCKLECYVSVGIFVKLSILHQKTNQTKRISLLQRSRNIGVRYEKRLKSWRKTMTEEIMNVVWRRADVSESGMRKHLYLMRECTQSKNHISMDRIHAIIIF